MRSLAQVWQTPGEGERYMEEELTDEFGISHLVENGVPREDAEANVWTTPHGKDTILALYRSAVDIGSEWQPDLERIEVPAMVIWGATMFAALVLQRTGRIDSALLLLLATSSGFMVGFFLQRKGWPYHSYPMIAFAMLGLGYAVAVRIPLDRALGIFATATFLLTNHVLPAKERATIPSLPGYVAVPVRYNSWNKMLMEAVVNGHRARLVVDTGAGYSVLEAGRAHSLGVSPVGADSPFGQFTNLNGERYRVGYINSLRAGTMDFGSGPWPFGGGIGVGSRPVCSSISNFAAMFAPQLDASKTRKLSDF